jgi:hypothetical protein
MQVFESTIRGAVNDRLAALEAHFDADVVFYYGEIDPFMAKPFRDFLEPLRDSTGATNRLVMFLNTPGGSGEAVEKIVEIIRFHYQEVFFIVPDFAMSAGTILCMSGDKIFMDYSSSLGPIDPQVHNGEEWVPALGYLDKVEQLLEKARNNLLTNAEFLILEGMDLALLSRYEQARDLTITLIKKWLVEYKFRDWVRHQATSSKKGQPVTDAEQRARAEEIAKLLGDNKLWHSHGRLIGPSTLKTVLRLRIDDYSQDAILRRLVRSYNDLLVEYIGRGQFKNFMHSRDFF